MATVDDVLDIVKQQHELLNRHMERVATAAEAQRKAYVESLRRLLAAHELAEDTYVETRENLAGHSERWVERLDEATADAATFADQFKEFRDELVRHTEIEIKHTMPKLLATMDPAQLERAFAGFQRVSATTDDVDDEEKPTS